MTTVRFIIIHMLLATAASTALAQPAPPPPLVNQEGVILDRLGFPLDEVQVQLTFRLYGAEEEGAPLWEESHDVFVRGGYYNVVLGSASDNSLFDVVLDSNQLWLQISIENETLLPRQLVVSTPFAMLAADAAALSCSGCVSPDNLSLTYAQPQDISWPNLGGIPAKVADLGALPCNVGQVPSWNGVTWVCITPPGGDTLALLSCAAGEVAKSDGIDWDCATDNDANTDTLAILGCLPNQVPQWDGALWQCANTGGVDTLSGLACAPNDVAKWTGAAWVCDVDVNTDTDTQHPLPSCLPGEKVTADGVVLSCAADIDTDTNTQHPLPTCLPGEKVTANGAVLSCAADIDTDTTDTAWGNLTGVPPGFADGTDNVDTAWGNLTGVPAGFADGADDDLLGTLVSCAAGEVAKWNGGAWACAPDTGTGMDTLASLSCGLNQVAKWNGGAWACAVDVDTDTTDTLWGSLIGVPGGFADGVDDVGSVAVPNCSPGEKLTGDGATLSCATDIDTNTQLAVPTCLAGQKLTGNGANLSCAADLDTDTTIAVPGCLPGEKITGDGIVLTCAPDTDTNTTYSGADFALSGQDCGAGSYYQGVSAAGMPICAIDAGTAYTEGAGLDLTGTIFSVEPAGIVNSMMAANSVGTAEIIDFSINDTDVHPMAAIKPAKIEGTAWTAMNDGPGTGMDSDTVDGFEAGGFWQRGGNAGTFPTNDFVGTRDTTALHISVDSTRSLRIEPTAGTSNLIGGDEGNTVNVGVVGAVVGGGGGFTEGANTITDDFGVVGGGAGNLAGDDSPPAQPYATVGGGHNNIAGFFNSTIGGGAMNVVGAADGTISGGVNNGVAGVAGTVGGGAGNSANGMASTVPGGQGNRADGVASFTAGTNAIASAANGDGCFVWADSTGGPLNCPSRDTVLMRGAGGFVFLTNGGGSTGATLDAGTGSWSSLSDRESKRDIEAVDPREVARAVADLPVSTWTYKGDEARTTHMGPMAQDFNRAFSLGRDERYINSSDADGVALAAIKGLAQEGQQQADDVQALRTQVQMLEARLSALEGGEVKTKGAGVLGQPSWIVLAGFGLALVLGRRRKAA